MVQTEKLTVEFFSSGYCTADASIVNPLQGKGKTKFYAVWALIKHSELGYILFDTGYNPSFYDATFSFPGKFYRWATPVFINPSETAAAILLKRGIAPDQINYIIISHFHADHIGGLKDFPKAKFICTQLAYLQMKAAKGIAAVSKGILKKLIPDDFSNRLLLVEDISEEHIHEGSRITIFNLFHKKEIQLFLLPGHARGMLGLYWEEEHKNYLFASDAGWSVECFDSNILPKKIVSLFFDSWEDFVNTQKRIRLFLKYNPSTELLFTHCPKTLSYIKEHV